MFDTWKRPVSKMPHAFQSYKPRHMKVYGAILINNFGEVLLVRGRLSKKWSFPKGHCKNSETDIECAKRELLEETGLLVHSQYTSYHKLKGGSYFVFAVTGRPEASFSDHREIEFVEWWPLNSLPITDSNVDVSIFRTLMRSAPCSSASSASGCIDGSDSEDSSLVEFIASKEAHQKVSSITRSMQ
jgi:ADP-ribose pyrophosphatase YjhB (NUDIX family)